MQTPNAFGGAMAKYTIQLIFSLKEKKSLLLI
jgi:hypothetical protein